jgi:serine/threonine protein phosphatase PrpC
MDSFPRKLKPDNLQVSPGFSRLSVSTQKLLSGFYTGSPSYRSSIELGNNSSLKYLKLAPIALVEQSKSAEIKKEFKPVVEEFKHTVKVQLPKRRVSRCAYLSHKGQINGFEKPQNQDGVLFLPKMNKNSHQFMFAVFDGHGESGHHISTHLRTTLKSSSISLSSNPTQIEMRSYLDFIISQSIKSLESSGIDIKNSGSTLCLLLISGNSIICANIGDSRCILGVQSLRWTFESLSKDHKPSDLSESERIKKMGGIITESFFDGVDEQVLRVWSGKKDEPALAMTRCIGDRSLKKIGVIQEPDFHSKTLEKNDKFFVLATDGLWDVFDCLEVVGIVSKEIDNGHAKQACEKLVNEAKKRWSFRSENVDDISVVVVLLNDD